MSKWLEHEVKVKVWSKCLLEMYAKDNKYVSLKLTTNTAAEKCTLM